MIIFLSGIAGLEEKKFLSNFKRFCERKEKEVKIFHFGKIMVEIARRDYPKLNKYSFVRFPRSTLNAWRAAAFERIIKEIDPRKVNLVEAHASFWIKGGPEPAINHAYLTKLSPDMYVQLIDSGVSIYSRLMKNFHRIPERDRISLMEILLWQDAEIYTSKIIADAHEKPYYLLAQRQPVSTLYNLIFDPKKIPIYQSYPMTWMREESYRKQVKRFIRRLRRHATIFDPGTIDTLEEKLTIRSMGLPKAKEIEDLIDKQTVRRDERLIDQSELVIAYFPKKVYTSGVDYEMNYAFRTGKPVWVVKPKEYFGPFAELHFDREFNSQDECIRALKGLLRERNKR
jgi:adenylate kinase/nucleoside 2-deoxyribosyltransferase